MRSKPLADPIGSAINQISKSIMMEEKRNKKEI
jgi:hypothetical protein